PNRQWHPAGPWAAGPPPNERWSTRSDSSIQLSIEEARGDPARANVQVDGEGRGRGAVVGVPVPARRTKLGPAAGGWVRESGGSAEGAAEGPRSDRPRPRRGDHFRRARRGVPGTPSSRTGDDREAALAARQSNERARRETDRGPVAEGRLRVAPDDPGRASLRGDASAASGPEPRGRLGASRLQPGEARCLEPAKAAEGDAAVRVLGTDRGSRREARTGVWTDGDLGRRNRTATLGTVRARATRRRP